MAAIAAGVGPPASAMLKALRAGDGEDTGELITTGLTSFKMEWVVAVGVGNDLTGAGVGVGTPTGVDVGVGVPAGNAFGVVNAGKGDGVGVGLATGVGVGEVSTEASGMIIGVGVITVCWANTTCSCTGSS